MCGGDGGTAAAFCCGARKGTRGRFRTTKDKSRWFEGDLVETPVIKVERVGQVGRVAE